MKFRRNQRLLVAGGTLGVALIASGCGGGGQDSAGPVPGAGGSRAGTTAVRLAVSIPVRTPPAGTMNSVRRVPQYLSPATAGLAVRAGVAGSAASAPWQLFDVSANAPACSTSAGLRTCDVSVTAPVVSGASDEFQIEATDQAPSPTGTLPVGHVLSSADVTQAVSAGAANQVSVALSGVIGSLVMSAPRYTTWAVPGQNVDVMNVWIVADDYHGGAIAGNPQSFANPIVFNDGLGGSSPFAYPSATSKVPGLPPPLVPGRIGAPIFYRAPTTGTAVSATVNVTTLVPTFLSLPNGAPGTPGPVATFAIDPMVVSVAGTPVASIPNVTVGAPDVTVMVTETGASTFTFQDPDNVFGDFQLLDASGSPLSMGPINVSSGSLTFRVHAVSVTSSPVPTFTVTDTTGTTATISVVVCAPSGCGP